MKYVVCDVPKDGWGDNFTEEFGNRESAITKAKKDWRYLTRTEQKKRRIYVLESVNPDVEAEDHFDGDIIWEAKEEG